ncbi:MAG: hypothetical protein LASZOEIN_002601 [Candidatus Fervidibacter sp.]
MNLDNRKVAETAPKSVSKPARFITSVVGLKCAHPLGGISPSNLTLPQTEIP